MGVVPVGSRGQVSLADRRGRREEEKGEEGDDGWKKERDEMR